MKFELKEVKGRLDHHLHDIMGEKILVSLINAFHWFVRPYAVVWKLQWEMEEECVLAVVMNKASVTDSTGIVSACLFYVCIATATNAQLQKESWYSRENLIWMEACKKKEHTVLLVYL